MSFAPVFDRNSRLLILGTYPSPRSREVGFYYGHPQNRFWPLIAELFGEPVPDTIDEKTSLLLRCGLALWDVCGLCEVSGASDASIRAVQPNDVAGLLRDTGIRRIYCNGTTAGKLYDRYILPSSGRSAQVLPSTSPANARWRMEMLMDAWSVLK